MHPVIGGLPRAAKNWQTANTGALTSAEHAVLCRPGADLMA
jgi:hypothetical protein